MSFRSQAVNCEGLLSRPPPCRFCSLRRHRHHCHRSMGLDVRLTHHWTQARPVVLLCGEGPWLCFWSSFYRHFGVDRKRAESVCLLGRALAKLVFPLFFDRQGQPFFLLLLLLLPLATSQCIALLEGWVPHSGSSVLAYALVRLLLWVVLSWGCSSGTGLLSTWLPLSTKQTKGHTLRHCSSEFLMYAASGWWLKPTAGPVRRWLTTADVARWQHRHTIRRPEL